MMPPIAHCSKGIVAMQGWSRGGWLFSRASRWFLVVLTVVGVLAASSCTFLGNADAREALIRDGGTTIEFHGIVVSLPDGVAPVGTKVSVRREAQKGTSAEAVAVSDGVVIELEGGLQPAEPLTLVFPVSQNEVPDADDMPELLVVRSTSGDGQVDLHAGTYDEKAGTYTVDVDHLSGFQVFGIDLGAVLQEVRTGVMQGLGLEFPAPDCVGEAVTIDDVTYRVESPPQSWICLEAKADALVVKAYPNSAIPFVVGSWPSAEVRTSPTEVQLATSALVVLAKHLGFTDSTQAAVMPGTMAELRFSSAPESVTVTFEQYPALLLVAILITTVDTILDVLGVQTFIRDVPEALQCFAAAADVADRGVALNGESAGGITRAFFDCAGPMLGDALSAKGAIILTSRGAAPGFLIASVLGIVDVLTGQARVRLPLDVKLPDKTRIVHLEPLTPAGQIADGFTLDTSYASNVVDCRFDTGSPSGVSPGTHACGTTADNCMAAVSSPYYPGSILCLQSAFDPTLQLRKAANLPATGVPDNVRPFGIETRDGSQWFMRTGGAWGGRSDGAGAAYGCSSGPCESQRTSDSSLVILAVEGQPIVDQSTPMWTVLVGDMGIGDINFPPPTRTDVVRVWYLSNPGA